MLYCILIWPTFLKHLLILNPFLQFVYCLLLQDSSIVIKMSILLKRILVELEIYKYLNMH